ncbi:hypothetical protein KC320_g31 [Hortaea werneckii]|nr:hypothetical protein KC320_g31 [Hortaea werneckii]
MSRIMLTQKLNQHELLVRVPKCLNAAWQQIGRKADKSTSRACNADVGKLLDVLHHRSFYTLQLFRGSTSIRPKTVPYGSRSVRRHQKVGKLKVGTPHSVDSLLAPLRQEDGKDVEAPDLVKRQIVRFGPDILAATER